VATEAAVPGLHLLPVRRANDRLSIISASLASGSWPSHSLQITIKKTHKFVKSLLKNLGRPKIRRKKNLEQFPEEGNLHPLALKLNSLKKKTSSRHQSKK
jgi:hypothetical protein